MTRNLKSVIRSCFMKPGPENSQAVLIAKCQNGHYSHIPNATLLQNWRSSTICRHSWWFEVLTPPLSREPQKAHEAITLMKGALSIIIKRMLGMCEARADDDDNDNKCLVPLPVTR